MLSKSYLFYQRYHYPILTASSLFTSSLADHTHLWTGGDIFSELSKKLCRHTQVSGLRYGMAKILCTVEAILAR